jgi:hypothetical protein
MARSRTAAAAATSYFESLSAQAYLVSFYEIRASLLAEAHHAIVARRSRLRASAANLQTRHWRHSRRRAATSRCRGAGSGLGRRSGRSRRHRRGEWGWSGCEGNAARESVSQALESRRAEPGAVSRVRSGRACIRECMSLSTRVASTTVERRWLNLLCLCQQRAPMPHMQPQS